MDLRSSRPLVAAARWLVAGAAVLVVVGAWATCGRTALGPSRPTASGSPLYGTQAQATPAVVTQASATPAGSAPATGVPPAGSLTSGTQTNGTQPSGTPASGTPASETAGARGLEAACTVARFSRFVNQRRLAAARRLLAGRHVWPRRGRHAIRRIDFISARVWGDSRADVVTLAATVRLAVRRGCPLPDGLTTLYFTLGRDGSAGDWLIKAVRTSP
jgi:hypothetical protein